MLLVLILGSAMTNPCFNEEVTSNLLIPLLYMYTLPFSSPPRPQTEIDDTSLQITGQNAHGTASTAPAAPYTWSCICAKLTIQEKINL